MNTEELLTLTSAYGDVDLNVLAPADVDHLLKRVDVVFHDDALHAPTCDEIPLDHSSSSDSSSRHHLVEVARAGCSWCLDVFERAGDDLLYSLFDLCVDLGDISATSAGTLTPPDLAGARWRLLASTSGALDALAPQLESVLARYAEPLRAWSVSDEATSTLFCAAAVMFEEHSGLGFVLSDMRLRSEGLKSRTTLARAARELEQVPGRLLVCSRAVSPTSALHANSYVTTALERYLVGPAALVVPRGLERLVRAAARRGEAVSVAVLRPSDTTEVIETAAALLTGSSQLSAAQALRSARALV